MTLPEGAGAPLSAATPARPRLHVRATRWLAALAHFGGLVGLLFVVVQLQQNRAQTRAQTRHELAATLTSMLDADARDAQLSGVIVRAAKNEYRTETEGYQFTERCNAYFRYWEDVSYQHRQGLYDQEEFARQQEAWARLLARSAGLRACWADIRDTYSATFEREMDALLAHASAGRGRAGGAR